MKNLKDFFEDLLDGIIVNLAIKMVVAFLKYTHKTLIEHPVKYWINYSMYIFYTKINFYFFALIFPLACILIALFDPSYNAMPRFLATYIMLGTGLVTAIVLKQVNKDWIKPEKSH